MADARYVIDIAAEMSGTETLAELDALTDKLTAGGKRSDDFQKALRSLTADLDAAKVASAETAAALAQGNDAYRLLERDAVRAAKAVEKASLEQPLLAAAATRADSAFKAYAATLQRAGVATDEESAKLKALELAAGRAARAVERAADKHPQLVAAAAEAKAKVDAHTVALRGLEQASAAAATKQDRLAKAVGNVNKLGAHAEARYQALNQRLEKMGQAVQFLPAPLQRVAMGLIGAQRAGAGLLHTLGGVRTALLLTSVGALAAVGAFAAMSVAILKRIPGADKQLERLGKNVKDLFKGLNFEPLQRALGVIVGFFDKANPLAEVFRIVGTAAFDSVSAAILATVYAVEGFLLDVSIVAVKAYLFFRKYGDEIVAVLEGLGIAALAFGAVWAVMNAGVIVGLAAQAGAWVVAQAAAVGAWLAMAAPAILVVAAIAAVGYAISQLILHWAEVVEGVKLIWSDLTGWLYAQVTAFTDIGANLMHGLVAGITGAVGAVVSSVTGAVGSAIDAAKSVLGIASPSKVFAEIGDNTVAGFTGAVDAGAGEAQGSMAALAAPEAAAEAAPSAGAQAAVSSGAAGGGKTVTIGTITITGVPGADALAPRLADVLTRLLEDDADSLGGAELAGA